jgi:hypothetical protein
MLPPCCGENPRSVTKAPTTSGPSKTADGVIDARSAIEKIVSGRFTSTDVPAVICLAPISSQLDKDRSILKISNDE